MLSRLLWRLLVASLGWLVAIAASIATVVGASVGRSMQVSGAALLDVDPHAVVTLAFAFLAATKAVWLGWLAFALYSEFAGLRSLLVHLLGFAVIALLGAVALAPVEIATCVAAPGLDCGRAMVETVMTRVPGSIFRVLAAAGVVAGFGYWVVAGGSAGFRAPAARPAPERGDARPPHA
jgi:hypothetical protein